MGDHNIINELRWSDPTHGNAPWGMTPAIITVPQGEIAGKWAELMTDTSDHISGRNQNELGSG